MEWLGRINNDELNALHADAFQTGVVTAEERDWHSQLHRHSLGWVAARAEDRLVGFVNVVWDGLVHAWIQDTMVATDLRRRGGGARLVGTAHEEAKQAGCEWLHVDFEDRLRTLYYQACGFTPTSAGLIRLD